MHDIHVARSSAPTLRQVWEIYLERKPLAKTTKDLYRRALNWGVQDWMDLPVDRITRLMVADRHCELSRKNGPRGQGKDAANLTFRTMRSLLNFAIHRLQEDSAYIKDNPVNCLSDLRAWNKTTKRHDIIDEHLLPIWFKEVLSHDDPLCRDYLLILLFMAYRRREACLLKWNDVNFRSGLITARETKNHKEHTLPMPQFVIDLLSRRYWYMKPRSHDYIFPGRFGGHLSVNYKGYQELWEPMGFTFRLHALRRTTLTTGALLGIPELHIAWIANHENDASITRRYMVKNPEVLREHIEKISEKLQSFMELTGT